MGGSNRPKAGLRMRALTRLVDVRTWGAGPARNHKIWLRHSKKHRWHRPSLFRLRALCEALHPATDLGRCPHPPARPFLHNHPRACPPPAPDSDGQVRASWAQPSGCGAKVGPMLASSGPMSTNAGPNSTDSGLGSTTSRLGSSTFGPASTMSALMLAKSGRI